MALTTIKTTAIADDAVTADKLANSINSEIAANTAKVSLASDSVTGAKIADDAVGAEHIEVLDAALQFGDSVKSQFGAGNDLEIYHDASNSYLDETGTGSLILRATPSIEFRKAGSTEKMLYAEPDAQVELYYDNVKQINTTSTGVTLGDSKRIDFGDGADLKIFHDGSNSYIDDTGTGSLVVRSSDFLIRSPASAEIMADFHADGAAELYYDNSKKLHTFSGGVKFFGTLEADDSDKIKLGDGADLEIFHDGSDSWIKDVGSGRLWISTNLLQVIDSTTNETMLKCTENGSVELYYDNVKHFETNAGGVKVNDNLYVGFGNGNDLKIYHNGSTGNYIDSINKDLYLRCNVDSDVGGDIVLQAKSGENSAIFRDDEGVELYYDNSKKFETTNTGITVTGSCSGCDFNFSNMNPENSPANEVDGTRGSWTLQEGVDDLFLINRLNGKKYKFNLTEVS